MKTEKHYCVELLTEYGVMGFYTYPTIAKAKARVRLLKKELVTKPNWYGFREIKKVFISEVTKTLVCEM